MKGLFQRIEELEKDVQDKENRIRKLEGKIRFLASIDLTRRLDFALREKEDRISELEEQVGELVKTIVTKDLVLRVGRAPTGKVNHYVRGPWTLCGMKVSSVWKVRNRMKGSRVGMCRTCASAKEAGK